MGGWFSTLSDEEEYLKYRDKATEYARKRDECFQLSQTAYQKKDHDQAKKMSLEGKRYQQLMEEANRCAADKIFRYNNTSDKQPEGSIDLHGLFVNEALVRLKKRVDLALHNRETHLIVIVGKGNRSVDGPKIKPAVCEFAEIRDIRYLENTPNAGCIRFEFDIPKSLCVIC